MPKSIKVIMRMCSTIICDIRKCFNFSHICPDMVQLVKPWEKWLEKCLKRCFQVSQYLNIYLIDINARFYLLVSAQQLWAILKKFTNFKSFLSFCSIQFELWGGFQSQSQEQSHTKWKNRRQKSSLINCISL